MTELQKNLLKAKESGYWSARFDEKKNRFIHILYIQTVTAEDLIEDKVGEIPVLEFETLKDKEYYDFYYPIKFYIEPKMGLKGCVKIKSDERTKGLEEFKKLVLEKAIEIQDNLEIKMTY